MPGYQLIARLRRARLSQPRQGRQLAGLLRLFGWRLLPLLAGVLLRQLAAADDLQLSKLPPVDTPAQSAADTPAAVADGQPPSPVPGSQLDASAGETSAQSLGAPAAPASTAAAPSAATVWSHVPPLRPVPRMGWFTVPPNGPGYYSFADLWHQRWRDRPPPMPFPPVSSDSISFFAANYHFLDDIPLDDRELFDRLKRRHPNSDWMWSLGGEERVRGVLETDARLTAVNDDFVLTRSRLYCDVWYSDVLRVYAEMEDSRSTHQSLPPLTTDVNPADLLNLFADVKVWQIDGSPVYVRGGRQELYYGSQRLISTSDWSNVRRTFSGVKGYYRSDKLDVDAFWAQPMEVLPDQFDHPDPLQQFVGLWANYRPRAGQQIDLYYLLLDNTHQTFTGSGGAVGGYCVDTFGARYAGDYQNVLWDFEGMLQCGSWVNQRIAADAYAVGAGYRWSKLRWDPHWWVYYEVASGDQSPGSGDTHGTFNELFAWGHYYFGYLDLVGRQNIRDLNTQISCYPAPWITTLAQFHVFRLDSARDALYNASGTAIRQDISGAAGTDVGDEIDFTVNFHLARRHELFVGYSKLFAGSFIRNTGPAVSPELSYVSYSFKW